MGRKLPTIKEGLRPLAPTKARILHTHIFSESLFTVNEKQHLISGSFEFGSGFLSEQLVKIAFWLLSNAIAPNFSQYDTSEGSARISWRAMFP